MKNLSTSKSNPETSVLIDRSLRTIHVLSRTVHVLTSCQERERYSHFYIQEMSM